MLTQQTQNMIYVNATNPLLIISMLTQQTQNMMYVNATKPL